MNRHPDRPVLRPMAMGTGIHAAIVVGGLNEKPTAGNP
jgi:hypothetical protein